MVLSGFSYSPWFTTHLRPGAALLEGFRQQVWYEHVTPLDLPQHTVLPGYAEITGYLLLQTARRYAPSGHIGVLLASLSSTSRSTEL
jgi:hypothetical protein